MDNLYKLTVEIEGEITEHTFDISGFQYVCFIHNDPIEAWGSNSRDPQDDYTKLPHIGSKIIKKGRDDD